MTLVNSASLEQVTGHFSFQNESLKDINVVHSVRQSRWFSRYSDWLRAGRSGNRISVEARFSAPAQTYTGTHRASSIMGTGSFPRVKRTWRGVKHPLPSSTRDQRKSRAIPLFPFLGFMACSRMKFTFFYLLFNTASRSTFAVE
jgi:hypothetical protein